MSVAMALTYELLRLRTPSTRTAESALATARARVPAPPTATLLRVATVEVDGPVVRLTPKSGARSAHVIYTHGGCYLYPVKSEHWDILATLIAGAGVSVDLPLYPLAPTHTMDEAYSLLERVYDDATARHERVFLAGDSAGGGLALGQALHYRDTARLAPTGVILFSPWVDLTLSNPAVPELAKRDRMLGADGLRAAGLWWSGSHDPRTPLASPLFGDLAGLPPVHVFQGGYDLLAADAVELVGRIGKAGGGATLELVERAFHVYVGAPWTPEARASLRRVVELLS